MWPKVDSNINRDIFQDWKQRRLPSSFLHGDEYNCRRFATKVNYPFPMVLSLRIVYYLALGKWLHKISLLLRFQTKDVALWRPLLVGQMLVLCALKLNRLLIKHSLKPGSPGLRYHVFFVVKNIVDNPLKGVRMVTICRDQSKKFGLKLKSIDAGIFCCFVSVDSPAALVGIRFGDQILKIDGQDCAGMSSDKAFKMLTKADDLKCEVRSILI